MYVFMVSVFLMFVVRGVSPTTCGSASFGLCNSRLLRRADTLFASSPAILSRQVGTRNWN